ncbi:MAG: DNA-directed RNA polymerase subunit alpha C-terminal domain-containing protein [Planctomycetota bacterium]
MENIANVDDLNETLEEIILFAEMNSDLYARARSVAVSRHLVEEELEALLGKVGEDPVRRGAVLDFLGRREEALQLLASDPSNAYAAHLRGKLLIEMGHAKTALGVLESAWKEHGGTVPAIGALLVEAKILTDDIDGARTLFDQLGIPGDHPRVRYLKGLVAQENGDYADALDHYTAAAEAVPGETRYQFRLGYLHSLHGDEEKAIEAYEMCQRTAPIYTHAMLNLGLLYEDAERYEEAIMCYRMVLQSNPDHERAALYLVDAEQSLSMYYDRDMEKENVRRQQLLQIPITDFELSVRSRNCLAKMNIHTLGDLIQKSEAELLSYKNFGETSLAEIKRILAQKNFRLGEGKRDDHSHAILPDGEHAKILGEPVSVLELSSRSQRCMDRLGIETLSDLVKRSELELISQKNFGVTSLNEVKRKLNDRGLSLASG